MDDIFQGFTGRDDDLRHIERYSMYTVMLYRSNLYTHSRRVAALVKNMRLVAQKSFGKDYDSKKAEIMALVHDDAEIIFGDVQAGNKSKMTPAQLSMVGKAEEDAIKIISRRYPRQIGGYDYRKLLEEYKDYSSLESQVVCYADKYDALGEALHEIYAGNDFFVTNVTNEYGTIPTPLEYYTGFFLDFRDKFPLTARIFGQSLDMLEPIKYDLKEYRAIAKNGTPHTKRSVQVAVGDLHYDVWRKVVLESGDSETIEALYVQREGL